MKRAVHASDERSKLRPVEKAALPIDSRVRAATRTALVILLVVLALWVASDFLSALAWAAIIAITTWPIYTRFAALIARGRAPALAALLFTLLTGLALLVPVILTVHQLTQGSEGFARWVTQLRAEGLPVPGWVAQLPIAGEYLDRWWQTNLSNPKAMVEWLRGINIESITAWTSALGGALLHRLFLFLVTMIALFLVLRDGAWLAGRVLATTDLLLGGPGERLASKIANAIRGAVRGTVAVAIADGIILGMAYTLAGVPQPLMFAVLTMAFAMVPFGAWVVFTSATLVLLLHGGSLWEAAVLDRLLRVGVAHRRQFHSAGAHRRHDAAAFPAGVDRNSRRADIVRIGRPFPRSGDHGRASYGLARMDGNRGLSRSGLGGRRRSQRL